MQDLAVYPESGVPEGKDRIGLPGPVGNGGAAYLSAAPQAEPQAAGFCSGLPAAPQAEPHAETVRSLFHSIRFLSAMSHSHVFWIQRAVRPL